MRWALRDIAVFAGMSGAAGLVLGGWKAFAIALGRPTSRSSAAAWLGLFAAFIVAAVVETVRTVYALGSPI